MKLTRMHEIYKQILQTHFTYHSPNTVKTVTRFYNRLPPPEELQGFVTNHLTTLAARTQWTCYSFPKPIEATLSLDLFKDITLPALCLFAGWSIGSPMAQIYIHLLGRDLQASFSKIHGLSQEPDEQPALMSESMNCPRCKTTNQPNARFCTHCSLVLDHATAL